ncbi:MAG TPA: DUF1572 family protein [Flavobacteriaceae bacterium]|nr:DUF1572 family protein [Flavobacteriaceae bacterium]MCB9212671.1 DUF1572 family protein [Alteromonas sp.]HPF11814.1 DUF1572 family protein [Flavobacteriaceae bacterium]HQU20840.1 DUF1572 family protein [Flavobacteriaceae bacterium]HQU65015.1 DUF1572 family protein [Flavobacteriaceae bacterium]
MKPTHLLAHRLREVILNGYWVANTNCKDQLEGLDWNLATSTQHSRNSIAVLAQHLHYYLAGIIQVFEDGPLEIRDAHSFDFPPITSQAQWEAFLKKFWDDTERLAQCIEALPEAQLNAPFADAKYGTYLRNIEGMIEHAYYHLGQMVLLKKMLQGHP